MNLIIIPTQLQAGKIFINIGIVPFIAAISLNVYAFARQIHAIAITILTMTILLNFDICGVHFESRPGSREI